MAKRGRRTKYTPETVKKLTDAIALGSTYRLACYYAGISEDTFINWRDTKPDFSAAVKEAEGRGTVGWLAKIEKAANDGEWTAAAWKLERRYPREFGRRTMVEIEDHVRKLAAEAGLDEQETEAAVREAESILKGGR